MANQEQKDNVNHPKHYTKHPSGVECIQITRHMNFNRGNAIKYIWRAGEKGNELEDLNKAIWYLNDEIAMLEARQQQEDLYSKVTVSGTLMDGTYPIGKRPSQRKAAEAFK